MGADDGGVQAAGGLEAAGQDGGRGAGGGADLVADDGPAAGQRAHTWVRYPAYLVSRPCQNGEFAARATSTGANPSLKAAIARLRACGRPCCVSST